MEELPAPFEFVQEEWVEEDAGLRGRIAQSFYDLLEFLLIRGSRSPVAAGVHFFERVDEVGIVGGTEVNEVSCFESARSTFMTLRGE